MSWLLMLDKEDRTLFRRYPIRSVIWGYKDPLLELGNIFDPSRFKTTEAGILQGVSCQKLPRNVSLLLCTEIYVLQGTSCNYLLYPS